MIVQKRKVRPRRGAAVAELAVCIPVILLLVFGSIEACGMIFLKQTLAAAAYEGIREAVDSNSTTASVQAECNALLSVRQIAGATITITPVDFDTKPAGTEVSVTVSAPTNSNRLVVTRFLRNVTISSRAVMLRE